MSTPYPRLSAKRLATRQTISDVATQLFIEHGFDEVTVDQIADAAGVGRMTVFSYFPRKDDMFFDLDGTGRREVLLALQNRIGKVSPVEALRQLAYRVVEEGMPYLQFSAASQRFIETIEGSDALKARARAIRDELTLLIAGALAESVGRSSKDSDAHLSASHLVTTWSVAFNRAHATYHQTQNPDRAKTTFLEIVDKGTIGLKAMMAGTPYV